MYKIIFYTNAKGFSSVESYLKILAKNRQNNKDSKIKLKKITAYIDLLSENGFSLGQPYIKYLKDGIWELRPLRDRILFANWDKNSFVLLHYFMKQTQKTPLKEIEQAKRNLEDYIRREKNG